MIHSAVSPPLSLLSYPSFLCIPFSVPYPDMGNCLTSNQVVSHDEINHHHEQRVELEASGRVESSRKRKLVKFKLREEDKKENGSTGGGMRIRVVVTKEELKQILSQRNKDLKLSCVEQLAKAVRLREMMRIHEAVGSSNGSWKPALESIPEDH